MAQGPPTFEVGYRSQAFAVRRDGGAHRLTSGRGQHAWPVWSHGGGLLATAGGKRILVVTRAGRLRHDIRGGRLFSGPVAWGPDDRRLAFVSFSSTSGVPGYDGALVVEDVDGGHRRVVLRGVDGQPAWSRDGSTIYVRRGRRDTDQPERLDAVPARGGAARPLASRLAPGDADRVVPSPDGRLILFSRFQNGDELWVVRPDGSGERRIVSASYVPSYGWTRDGRTVYGGKAGYHPVVTTLDGKSRALRATFGSDVWDLSPDARWVAWAQSRKGVLEVRSARSDGGRERVLARFESNHDSTDVGTLAWSPDGRLIAVEPYRHIGD